MLFWLASLVGLALGAPMFDQAAPTSDPCYCPPVAEYTINTRKIISSPGFTSNQICANVKCKYRVFANNGQHVRITFNKFIIFGSLTIYNGPKGDDSELILAKLQGELNTANMPPIYSSKPNDGSGGVVTLVYVASAAVPEEANAISTIGGSFGFQLTFTTTADAGCGVRNVHQNLFGNPVTIHSPNYPYNYPPNLACTWNFTAPAGKLAQVTFSSDSQTELGYDFVTIYNEDGSVAASDSGTSVNFAPIKGSTNGFRITFSSDDAVIFPGFMATLSGYTPPTNCSCGQTVYYLEDVTKTATIQSPNFGPGHSGYCENANCTYNLIVRDTQYKAMVSFQAFELEQGYDHLTINDGINGFQLEDCTGNHCDARTSDNNELTLNLVTDASVGKAGFSAIFSAVLIT